MTHDDLALASEARRNFIKLAGTGSLTAAIVAASGGMLWSTEAVAQTQQEERERERAADHIMILATPYNLDADRSLSIMQLHVKENIQNATEGKVYVRLASGGQLGVGSPLVQAVQAGTIQCALHSLSNFAPYASPVDLVNLPYFCGSNQRSTNLLYSDAWKAEVHPRIEEAGFKVLFYVATDSRVVAMRKGKDPVFVPSDLSGVKFRVPGSSIIQQFYRMAGANPTPIAWGETPSAMKQGVADALDPSVSALFVFGFTDMLSHVTFIQAVPNSNVYTMNLEWFNSLPIDVREGIEWAGEMTAHQNLANVPTTRTFAMAEMSKAGVQFHSINEEQLARWQEITGYQRAEWDEYKKELAGSMDVFRRLEEAAGTLGRYYVHDA